MPVAEKKKELAFKDLEATAEEHSNHLRTYHTSMFWSEVSPSATSHAVDTIYKSGYIHFLKLLQQSTTNQWLHTMEIHFHGAEG